MTISEALEKLKGALTQVEDSKTLSDDRKASLKSMLKDRIRVSQLAADDPKENTELDGKVSRLAEPLADPYWPAYERAVREGWS